MPSPANVPLGDAHFSGSRSFVLTFFIARNRIREPLSSSSSKPAWLLKAMDGEGSGDALVVEAPDLLREDVDAAALLLQRSLDDEG